MKINLKQLETFVWVADLGSFRRAASRLNTTQPNISSRITALESTIGVSLMERDAGSVRLTKRGSELLVYARRVLGSVDDFLTATENSSLFNDVLRLGVTEMVVNGWLPTFLQKLKEQYPNTVVELTVDLSAQLESELEQHNIDLALQSGPFRNQATGSLTLGSIPMVWVAAPSIASSLPKKVSISDLAQLPIIAHARNTKHFDELQQHFSRCHEPPARIMQCNNLAACVQMAVDGFGVAPILKPMVEEALVAGSLVTLNYNWQPSRLDFYARYDEQSASRFVTQAAQIASQVANKFARQYRKK